MAQDETGSSQRQTGDDSGSSLQRVVIRIEGRLDEKWAEWFEGFEINYTKSGDTTLRGHVRDQAALYGLIAKLRDLGVKLKSVRFSPILVKKARTKAKSVNETGN
jgi:hypothetical protein